MRRRLTLVLAVCAAALWLAPGAFASWCGTGESTKDLPDAVTAQQVHAVYVVPSDGADNFAAVANQLSDDTVSIDTWWATQDPTRNPRFDQALFPGCTGLDISFLRLAQTGAQLQGSASNAFDAVANALGQAGFGSTYKDYLAYYDGPAPEANICGTGAGDLGVGPGYAVVWLQGCPGVPTDTIAAHELLHALGAVPAGDPNHCSGDAAHVCDNSLDVLYPYASGQPLTSLYLDFNHDDYYAHAPGWPDIQQSPWLHLLQVAQVPLALTLSGAGSVTSDLPGVDCSATCTSQWDPGAAVTLVAAPAPGEAFLGWQGACTGQGDCTLTLSAAQSVTAAFGVATIALHVAVVGRGSVVCTPRCSAAFPEGAALHVRAVPAKGWRFAGWGGGTCAGPAVRCAPSTQAPLTIRAVFKRLPPPVRKPKKKP